MMNNYRLMNVAQVRVDHGRTSYDLRPTCVEIMAGPAVTLVVMLCLSDSDEYDPEQRINPRLIGRIALQCEALIHDAFFLDGQSWTVEGDGVSITISPNEGEVIWLDNSYTYGQVPNDLDSLYRQKRACKASLIATERLLSSTPAQQKEVRELHEFYVKEVQALISRFDRAIADKEAAIGEPQSR